MTDNKTKNNKAKNNKAKNNKIENNKGFSLVELMVVVAIIGILASIAVPNFQRFQSRARQSEARTNLGGFYQAAKASYAEYSFYPGNLPATGWQPEGQLRYDYASSDHSNSCGTNGLPGSLTASNGCDDACTSTHGGNASASTPVAGTSCAFIPTFTTWTDLETGVDLIASPVLGAGVTLGAPISTNTAFITVACGSIGGSTTDCWSINESKTLSNDASGI